MKAGRVYTNYRGAVFLQTDGRKTMLQVAFCASENAAMQEPVLFRGRLDQSFSLAKKLGYDGVELHIRDALSLIHI